MNSYVAAKSYPNDRRSYRHAAPKSHGGAKLATRRLGRRASLMLALLLSLGLWAAIWAAAKTLASVIFR